MILQNKLGFSNNKHFSLIEFLKNVIIGSYTTIKKYAFKIVRFVSLAVVINAIVYFSIIVFCRLILLLGRLTGVA